MIVALVILHSIFLHAEGPHAQNLGFGHVRKRQTEAHKNPETTDTFSGNDARAVAKLPIRKGLLLQALLFHMSSSGRRLAMPPDKLKLVSACSWHANGISMVGAWMVW